jgi:hypothetical protein
MENLRERAAVGFEPLRMNTREGRRRAPNQPIAYFDASMELPGLELNVAFAPGVARAEAHRGKRVYLRRGPTGETGFPP